MKFDKTLAKIHLLFYLIDKILSSSANITISMDMK